SGPMRRYRDRQGGGRGSVPTVWEIRRGLFRGRRSLSDCLCFTSPLGERSTVFGRVRGPSSAPYFYEGPLTRPLADLSPKGEVKRLLRYWPSSHPSTTPCRASLRASSSTGSSSSAMKPRTSMVSASA